jgi:hypothetical protein
VFNSYSAEKEIKPLKELANPFGFASSFYLYLCLKVSYVQNKEK